jgi:hypothetical protein
MGRPEDLQGEADQVLARLAPLGALQPTGSYVSGLMVSRVVDVMMLGGPGYSPTDVVALLARAVEIPGVTGFAYTDERDRDPVDQRHLVRITVDGWRVELSIWLHDDHAAAAAWHRELAGRLSDEQRRAILAIKEMWCERPEYPGGFDVCTAVLEHGVTSAVEFGAWLRTSR